jgi:uncharacterized membrane protein (DUF485 family)
MPVRRLGNRRLGWVLTIIITSTYVVFVAALGFVPRHHPELLGGGNRLPLAMAATLAFITAVVLLTAVFLGRSQSGPQPEQRPAESEPHA